MWTVSKIDINKYFYTDTAQMPMNKFNEFMNHVLLDNIVGGEIQDITDHLKRIYSFIEKDKKDHAKKECHNLFQAIHNVKTSNHPKKEALKFLLKEDTDLDRVPVKALTYAYDEVKKKYLLNLN